MQCVCGSYRIAVSHDRLKVIIGIAMLEPVAGMQPLRALHILAVSNNECSSLDGLQHCPALTALDADHKQAVHHSLVPSPPAEQALSEL